MKVAFNTVKVMPVFIVFKRSFRLISKAYTLLAKQKNKTTGQLHFWSWVFREVFRRFLKSVFRNFFHKFPEKLRVISGKIFLWCSCYGKRNGKLS